MLLNERQKPLFHKDKARSNPYRVIIWLVLLVGAIFLFRAMNLGDVKPLFSPTSTSTRTSNNFALEGETHFLAGNLDKAIQSYKEAVKLDPQNGQLWAELARIQCYSSNLLTTDAERGQRLHDALDSIVRAVKVAPDDSTVAAIHSFVLDWNANPVLAGDKSIALLTQAEQEASRARQLDNQNVLAQAYYAEILVDQQKLIQADQVIRQALQQNPSIMDVHRVAAFVRESLGYYGDAIDEYKQALKITPNLTFLYISAGANYRQLKQYDKALEYFAQATQINDNLGINDPIPYLSIGKTYSQMGEFFSASRNVHKALQINPSSPDTYGQLGMVYFKSKNFEGSLPAFQCAVYGCDSQKSCDVRNCDPAKDKSITIQGLPLSANTVVYYYTYGSALAGMHLTSNNYCKEAVQILSQVRDKFSGDKVIMEIVQASEQICASYDIRR